jgi:hypothetical protein
MSVRLVVEYILIEWRPPKTGDPPISHFYDGCHFGAPNKGIIRANVGGSAAIALAGPPLPRPSTGVGDGTHRRPPDLDDDLDEDLEDLDNVAAH